MRSFFTTLVVLFLLLLTTTAFAHRVNIFAWVEGDTIYTESSFSNGKKAQGATVIAKRAPDFVLATGTTDKNGQWSFPISQATRGQASRILLVLQAGEGHRATWTIPASEFSDAAPSPPPLVATSSSPKPVLPSASLMEARQRALIAEELGKQLKPIRRVLIAQQQARPTLHDVFSGLGYILGLFGTIAWITARKNTKTKK